MKTIQVELPDNTVCAFVSYLYIDNKGRSLMTVRCIDGGDLERGISKDNTEEAAE